MNKTNINKNYNSVLFTNALIVDPESGKEFKGDVLVENGIIKEVSSKPLKVDSDIEVIDCRNLVLAPGIIDAQVHIGEPGGSYKENIHLASKTAISGGVTTINIMPDTDPAIDTTALYEFIKNRAIEKSLCNITVFGSATKAIEGRELSEMGLLKKAGVKGVSDCHKNISDSLVFKRACEYAANFDLVIANQPNDKYLSENGVLNEGDVSTMLGVQGIPAIAEKIGLERDLAIAEITKAKYHALNITSELSVEPLKKAKDKNLKITANTTPHHISLTDEMAIGYRTYAKIDPPLRKEGDKKALIKALKSGVIDFISSDHSPRSEDQKRQTLQSAEFGVIGLQTLFSAAYTALSAEKFSLAEIFRLISLNPAIFLGLENKGKIKKGAVADLILFDIKESWVVDSKNFSGKAVNTPFDGRELKGKVVRTFISGVCVYEKK